MISPDHQPGALEVADLEDLVASLDRAIADMRQLAELLQEELRAIESRDPEGLLRLVGDKQDLLTRLDRETARQREWIEAAGFGFTPDGVERFIHTHDRDDRLATRWSALLDQTRRCHRLNNDNARSIERDQRRIAMMLRLLRGEDGGTTTYDPRGRTDTGGQRGRTISQA
ncbi:MAG: flagella synthesis protein FlgN [Thermochromatium sp.]